MSDDQGFLTESDVDFCWAQTIDELSVEPSRIAAEPQVSSPQFGMMLNGSPQNHHSG